MSRIRPWTNGDQVALDAGRVPVYQDEKDVWLFDSAGDPIVLDAGRVPVFMGDRNINLSGIDGEISVSNSTAVALLAGGVFTGVSEEITNKAIIFVTVSTDVASATSGLSLQQSSDGVNWDHTDNYTIAAGGNKNFSINPHSKFFRIVYTNGAVGQGHFRLQTIFKSVYAKPSSVNIGESIVGADDAELTKSVVTGEDENGIFQNARVSSGGYLITDDFFLEIAKGNVVGHSIYRKFGKIGAIQSATPADCWEYGVTVGAERYTWSTTAAIDSMSSSNAGDTQEITVIGLDGNYVEVTQQIILTGQVRVPLTTPLLRINRVYNSNGTPTLGDVYVYENTPIVAGVPTLKTMVRGYFSVSGQQSLQSMYTVPAGKSAYLYELKTSMGGRKTGFATYSAFLRTIGSIFLIKDTHDLSATGTSYANDSFTAPRLFPEKTDYLPYVEVDTNGIGFAVSFVIVLIDN